MTLTEATKIKKEHCLFMGATKRFLSAIPLSVVDEQLSLAMRNFIVSFAELGSALIASTMGQVDEP